MTPDRLLNIKQWRLEMSLTQEKAAQVLGISRRAYSSIELGKTRMCKRTIMSCWFYSECQGLYKDIGLDLLDK